MPLGSHAPVLISATVSMEAVGLCRVQFGLRLRQASERLGAFDVAHAALKTVYKCLDLT